MPPGIAPRLPTRPVRWQSRQASEEEGIYCVASTSSHGRRVARVGVPVRLPRVPFHQRRRRRGGHAPSHGHRGRALAWSQLPVARQPVTAVTEAAPLRSECLLDPDARQRGVDDNANSVGKAQRLQLSATAPHHREVVSRGGHQAFERPSDGCADADTSLAGPYPAHARRPPSAPCGVGLLIDTPLP